MDQTRAHDIAQSAEMKHVTYNGNRVYIQNVHEQGGMATIYELDNPQKILDVRIEDLLEN